MVFGQERRKLLHHRCNRIIVRRLRVLRLLLGACHAKNGLFEAAHSILGLVEYHCLPAMFCVGKIECFWPTSRSAKIIPRLNLGGDSSDLDG